MRSDLVIFHYHLFPGGVTNVVTLSVRAVSAYLPKVSRIRLVCGSDHHLQTLRRSFRDRLGRDPGPRVEFDVIPAIFYLSRDARPDDPEVPDVEGLKRILLSRYQGAVWWIHNYHLGKNPAFTQALLEIAEESPDQRMLFHIHDFPECARFDNLSLLERFVTLPLYPSSKNVRYAVINNRDLALLRGAGLRDDRLFLLNNPVPDEDLPEPNRDAVRTKLEKSFADRFPGYVRGGPLLFYPVRAIRRKNALEAGLIAKIVDAPANLIVTLPGVSEREAPYSQLVQGCFEDGTIPGMAGIGMHLAEAGIGFGELALSTDSIISSSVQEGFGYLFIDGRRWRKPVFARHLDILEGIEEIIDGESAYFYHAIKTPLDARRREQLAQAYRSKVLSISRFLPETAIERLGTAIEGAFSEETVDFSYLTADDQCRLLEHLSDAALRREVVDLNREPLEALKHLMQRRPEDIAERIQGHFSLQAFAAQTARILESFDTGPALPVRPLPAGHVRPTGESAVGLAERANRSDEASSLERGASSGLMEDGVHRNLRSGFAQLEYIRLLYE